MQAEIPECTAQEMARQADSRGVQCMYWHVFGVLSTELCMYWHVFVHMDLRFVLTG
jgi:hypothetical protein